MKLSQQIHELKKCVALSLFIFSLSGCGGDEKAEKLQPQNVAPKIQTFSVTPNNAFIGDNLVISASADDTDGDTLTYVFSSNLGNITETGNNTSDVCEEGLTDITLNVIDGRGGSDSSSIAVSCYLAVDEIEEQITKNFGLTNVVKEGIVSGENIDFTGTSVDGTVLGVVYNSTADFSHHNDVSARGVSGTAQRVLSIAKATESTLLPTTFIPAQDLMVISSTTKNRMANSMVAKNGTGNSSDICVSFIADETSDGRIKNIKQNGSYTFQGRDLTNSTLSFEEGQYIFALTGNGSVDLSTLANQVYTNVGAGIEALLNGKEINSDNVVNDVCDIRVLINPFTNTNPEVVIDSINYSATLADGITPRDVASISVSFTPTDADESTANLTTTGTISSAILAASTDLTLNNGNLEGSLLHFAGATDVVISLNITDSNGGSSDKVQTIGTIDLNDAPTCSPVSLKQSFPKGDNGGSVELINGNNCSDAETDSFNLLDNLLDTNTEGSYSQTVKIKDVFDSATDYTVTGAISAPTSNYEYVLAPLTFNISFAVNSCSAYLDGSYELATWETQEDLASIVSLCGTQQQYCFTQYKVESGEHISEIDGTLMPPYFSYFENTPDYLNDRSVMVRNDRSYLVEQNAIGYPICGKKRN